MNNKSTRIGINGLFDHQDALAEATLVRKPRLKLVTPAWASRMIKWTEDAGFENRHENPDDIDTYSRDMTAGMWVAAHPHGIIIDSRGFLIDGWHRLKAIIKSGMSILMWVSIVESRQEMAVSTDIGVRRSQTGGAHIDATPFRDEHQATARIVEFGVRSTRPKLSRIEYRQYIRKYWRGVDFVVCHGRGVGVLMAPIKAVLARAILSPASPKYMRNNATSAQVEQRILEFVQIYKTLVAPDPNKDHAPIALHRFMENMKGMNSLDSRCLIYIVTEIAVMKFLQREFITVLKPNAYLKDGKAKELFPIPEDEKNERFRREDSKGSCG